MHGCVYRVCGVLDLYVEDFYSLIDMLVGFRAPEWKFEYVLTMDGTRDFYISSNSVEVSMYIQLYQIKSTIHDCSCNGSINITANNHNHGYSQSLC